MRDVAPDEVLVKVHASGVCYGDHGVHVGAVCKSFPRVPGHEIVGRVAAVGSEIQQRAAPGDARATVGGLVGVGWNGGYCGFFCDECREGRFLYCNQERIIGATQDGGHAEYVFVKFSGAGYSAEKCCPKAHIVGPSQP